MPKALEKQESEKQSVGTKGKSIQKRMMEQELKIAGNLAAQANKPKNSKEPGIGLANISNDIKTPLNIIIDSTELLLGDEADASRRESLRNIWRAAQRLSNIINNMPDSSSAQEKKCDMGEAMVRRWLETGNDFFEPADFIHSYLLKLPAAIERLRDAIWRNQPEAIEFRAHEIKGVTGNLGMTEVYELAAGINLEIVKNGYDIGKIKKQFIDLQRVMASIPDAYFDGSYTDTVSAPLSYEPIQTENDTILVAEDNPVNQLFLKGLLRKMNFKADIANNGKEVLERLSQNRYGLLLLDIQMPVMDGLATIARIRAQNNLKKFPVIALTANTSANDVAQYLKAGCDDYLAKPIQPDKLEAKIRAMIKADVKTGIEKYFQSEVVATPTAPEIPAAHPEPAFLEIVTTALTELRENTRIFDPQKVREQAGALAELAEIAQIAPIIAQLNYSAKTFDDEVLASVIEHLEALL